jgi:hypothetical protein
MIKQQYNYNYLQQFCKDNAIKLESDYSKDKITRDTIIRGKCKSEGCNEFFEKTFRNITIGGGPYCKKCACDNKKTKTIDTNIGRYGCDYQFQSDDVKEKIKKTNIEKYGNENPMQNEEIKNKAQETCLIKYGAKHPSKNIEIQEKIKKTMVDNWGVEHAMQNEDIKNKSKETCLKNWGYQCSLQNEDIKNKSKETCIQRYGYPCSLQNEDMKNKSKETCIKRYGFENPMQNPEIMEKCSKNAFKFKDYILPSGRTIKIQGYEHYAFAQIIQEGVLEDDIINGCSNVPELWYEDIETKKHRHFVDIFIPSQNRMIEVKSTWTAEKKKDNIFLKQEAGKRAGYLYEIWVYNNKGEKVECYK